MAETNLMTIDHYRILVEAAQILSSEVGQQQLVRRLADFLVPRLADWCLVREVDEDGCPMMAVAAHSDPEKVVWAEQLSQQYPPNLEADYGTGYVLRTGKPSLIPEITGDMLVKASVDHKHLSLLRSVGMRSAIFAPALAHGQLLGVLTLIAAETDRRYGQDDLELAMNLGGYFGQLLYNARLYRLAEERRLSMQRAQDRWQFILEAAQVGIFEWDVATGEVWWSETLETAHGLAPGSFGGTFEAFQQDIHPEDVEGVLASIAGALEGGGTEYTSEYRIIRPEGEVRWLTAQGRVFLGPDGQPTSISGICMDITERKRAEETLREADRQKDEFLAMLSHELRSPLSPLQNAVNIMRKIGAPDPEFQWAQDVADRQIAHMKRLLDDLLDIARITRGKITLQRERLEATKIIDYAVEVARPVIDERGHQLRVSTPPGAVHVEGDLTRLAQALSNLLNNAAMYTPEGGRITLTAESMGQEAVFKVQDTGVGIPADLLPRIFHVLDHRGQAPHQENGGLGLGLNLVRGLIELHGGRVEARSEGPGRGSEFVIWLPAVEGPEKGPAPEQAAGPAPGEPGQRIQRVLIVEDQAVAAVTMAMLLEQEGYEVETAGDGPSALELSRTFRPEVIFLDIGLPGMDGHQVARQLREHPETRYARIIALSGYGQAQDINRSQEAGCNGHLVKPVGLEAMLEALQPANDSLDRK